MFNKMKNNEEEEEEEEQINFTAKSQRVKKLDVFVKKH